MLGTPHFELDYYRFRPNWVETPNDEFRESVREALRGDRWVADGNYGLARDVIWPRATMLVWLDYPIYVVMWRLFWRTIGRGVLRKELWHGNREKLWWHFAHARFAVPVGAEDSLAPSPADTGAVGAAGARSSGTGASAVAEGGAGVDERDSAGVNWGRKWGDYIVGPQNNSLSASPGATARIGERS